MTSLFSSLLSFFSTTTIPTTTTTCLHLPCINHYYDDDYETNDLKTISTCHSTLESSSSYYRRSTTMVHRPRQSHQKSSTKEASKNQLVNSVHPLDELLLRRQTNDPKMEEVVINSITTFPFDEILVSKTTVPCRYRFEDDDDDAQQLRPHQYQYQNHHQEQHRQTRQHDEPSASREPLESDLREDVMSFFGVPTVIFGLRTWEEDSQISCELLSEASSRTLTPHPSFDEPYKNNTMTASAFRYLYQASRAMEDYDWPSDEE